MCQFLRQAQPPKQNLNQKLQKNQKTHLLKVSRQYQSPKVVANVFEGIFYSSLIPIEKHCIKVINRLRSNLAPPGTATSNPRSNTWALQTVALGDFHFVVLLMLI